MANGSSAEADVELYCDYGSSLGEAQLYYIIAGGAIIVAMAFLQQRKRFPRLLFGRPSMPDGVDFLSTNHNRLQVVLTFSATAYAMVQLTTTDLGEAVIFQTALVYSPLIMCAGSDSRLVAPALGSLYGFAVLLWYSYSSVKCYQAAQITPQPSPPILSAATLQFAIKWPEYLTLLLFSLVSAWKVFVFVVIHRGKPDGHVRKQAGHLVISDHAAAEHVRRLLSKKGKEAAATCMQRFSRFLKTTFGINLYQWQPDFQYSTRILVIHCVSAIAVSTATIAAFNNLFSLAGFARYYVLTREACPSSNAMSTTIMTSSLSATTSLPTTASTATTGAGGGTSDVHTLATHFHRGVVTTMAPTSSGDQSLCTVYSENVTVDAVTSIFGLHLPETSYAPLLYQLVDAILYSSLACVFLASITQLLFMLHMLSCYRKHIRRLWRRDYAFLPSTFEHPSGNEELLAGLQFSGQQIAFFLWGWLILWLLGVLIVVVVTLNVVLLIFWQPYLLTFLRPILNSFVVAVAADHINKVLVNTCFGGEQAVKFSINNRRFFNFYAVYSVFVSVVVGFYDVLKRAMLAALIGAFFSSRLDKSLMVRGYEERDDGFQAYLLMLFHEVRHYNPTARVFLQLLVESRNSKPETDSGEELFPVAHKEETSSRRKCRNRWQLALTLIHNPDLKALRRQGKASEPNPSPSTNRKMRTLATALSALSSTWQSAVRRQQTVEPGEGSPVSNRTSANASTSHTLSSTERMAVGDNSKTPLLATASGGGAGVGCDDDVMSFL